MYQLSSTTKWFINIVFPGVAEVIASDLRPVSILISDDLPTLERPIKAYSGIPVSGHLLTSVLLITKRAFFTSILIYIYKIATATIQPSSKTVPTKIVKGERRAKRKRSFQVQALPSRSLSYPKIVKGERRDRRKQSFQVQALPSRSLSYPKIVKGERRAKRKRSFQAPALPSRSLSYPKIAKGERRDRRKQSFQVQALPSRLLSYPQTLPTTYSKQPSTNKKQGLCHIPWYSPYKLFVYKDENQYLFTSESLSGHSPSLPYRQPSRCNCRPAYRTTHCGRKRYSLPHGPTYRKP